MTSAEYNLCVDQYADRFYRFILKNIKNEADASDIVQESYEKLWRNHKKINFEKSRTYLFTTGYHTMIDWIRKNKKMLFPESMPEPAEFHMPDTSFWKDELEKGIAKLPEIQRSVVLLRDYEGYSYREISDITGLNEPQVKVYIFRARKFLKKFIGSIDAILL